MGQADKICEKFFSVGHSAGFGYALWAIAQDLAMRYANRIENYPGAGPNFFFKPCHFLSSDTEAEGWKRPPIMDGGGSLYVPFLGVDV